MKCSIDFILPGVPAPIGGFKVVYQHASILTMSGYDVSVQHVNPELHRKKGIRKLRSWIVFQLRRMVDRWRKYPAQYNVRYSTSNFVRVSKAKIYVVASWQLLEEMIQTDLIPKESIIHIAMDFPKYMGPEQNVIDSWKHPIPYIAISTHLAEKIKSLNPDAEVYYLPAVSGIQVPQKPRHGVNSCNFFCVLSTGRYKNFENLIILLNKLSESYTVRTFSRGPRPHALSSSVMHNSGQSDDFIAAGYCEAQYSVSYSKFEGFGLPGFEAMLSGCAVFTTDNLGNRDYAKFGANCIKISGDDPIADFERITAVINGPPLLVDAVSKAAKEDTEAFLNANGPEAVLYAYRQAFDVLSIPPPNLRHR